MGNTFGFLSTPQGGFQFAVVNTCKAEGIDLNQTCTLSFNPDHTLKSIGNMTRGTMKPQPGIAGVGIWFAMMVFFGIIVIALVFVVIETLSRSTKPDSTIFAFFKDTPTSSHTYINTFRSAGRTFVLGAADTQSIFITAFLLSFAAQTKCALSTYHFGVALHQMLISLAVLTFSVALVRTYWRNPLAAGVRVVLGVAAFAGVGVVVFGAEGYGVDRVPVAGRRDSVVLVPVGCVLDGGLRARVKGQTDAGGGDIGLGTGGDVWPVERWFYIMLVGAYVVAHLSVPVRFAEARRYAPARWTRFRGWITVVYWGCMLVPPTVVSVYCWTVVYKVRNWVRGSGWMESPNTEFVVWDSGQLIAMGVVVTVLMNMLSEAWKREGKGRVRDGGEAFERLVERDGERGAVGMAELRYDGHGRRGYQGY